MVSSSGQNITDCNGSGFTHTEVLSNFQTTGFYLPTIRVYKLQAAYTVENILSSLQQTSANYVGQNDAL
jgi:hypothetical protein